MRYITHKRFKQLAICGNVNIPAVSECEEKDQIIYHNNRPLCAVTSENAHTFFAINEDGQGLIRGKLVRDIVSLLQKKDEQHQERWDKVWDDELCQKYKRKEHSDHWLWNHDFYNASIGDLTYIWNLIRGNWKCTK